MALKTKCVYKIVKQNILTTTKITVSVRISRGCSQKCPTRRYAAYGDALAGPNNAISEPISDDIPHQIKILNMVIDITQ